MATGNPREDGPDAGALQLGEQFGLGECTGSWTETSYLVRVVLGWVFVFVAVIGGIAQLRTAHDRAGVVTEAVIALAVGTLMAAIPPRQRRVRLFLFEGGVVRACNLGQRLVVLPWADLDTLTVRVDDEGDVSNCVLRGRSGTRLALGKYDGPPARQAIRDAAEQVLASRR